MTLNFARLLRARFSTPFFALNETTYAFFLKISHFQCIVSIQRGEKKQNRAERDWGWESGVGGRRKADRFAEHFRTTTRFASLPAHCRNGNPHPASPKGEEIPRRAACRGRAISGAGFTHITHIRMTKIAFLLTNLRPDLY
jgi:hypothetical protein